MSDTAAPVPPADKNKNMQLRPMDQERLRVLRVDTGIDNDVDVIRFALAELCKERGLDVEDPMDAYRVALAKWKEANPEPKPSDRDAGAS